MLGSARRRRAIARLAQIAGFAASAMMALSAMPAAEPAANGRVGAGSGAGTIEGALILAYRNNPQLNAQRSSTRATGENVPTALAGYRAGHWHDDPHGAVSRHAYEVGNDRRRNRGLYA